IENYSETPGNNNLIYEIRDADNALVDELAFAGHAYNRYGNLSKTSIGVGGNYDNRIYVGAGLN
ncbi:MAG TPA: hemin receptor, partial [Chryseobacterium sp.]|nr:hemin receptor [Chryseobacterium sp.]